MKSTKSPFLYLLVLMTVVSLACSSLAQLSPTATPEPTATQPPTLIPPSPTPEGPVSSAGNPIVVSAGGLELANERYEHPGGFVSFYPMKDWEISETDNSVTLIHPDTRVVYSIIVNNTGYPLDSEAFANFRNNAEEFYQASENYKEIDSGANEAIQLYYVDKTYSILGNNLYATSIYQQFDNVIFSVELYGDPTYVSSDDTNPYYIMFNSFFQTLEISSETASQLPLYQQTWEFTAEDAPATVTVPWHWSLDTYNTKDLIGAFFYSPDNKAGARFVTFATINLVGATGKKIGKDLALSYLEGMTSNKINVLTDVADFQPGGAYVFGWETTDGRQQGVVVFDTRIKNKLIMVILSADADVFELYRNLLATIGDSYRLEQ